MAKREAGGEGVGRPAADDEEGRRMMAEKIRRNRIGRNRALLAVLGGLAVLFYLLTFVILGRQ